jgi:hypothetical protein
VSLLPPGLTGTPPGPTDVDPVVSTPGWLASPAEIAAAEQAETERIRQGVDNLAAWNVGGCAACPTGNGWGHPRRLCPDCATVVASLELERARAVIVDGIARAEWCRQYLDRQEATR